MQEEHVGSEIHIQHFGGGLSRADSMSSTQSFEHEVSAELAELIPEAIREDPDKRKEYVDLALSYGLKAIIQTQGGVDKSAIRDGFERWKKEVGDKLIGEGSDFETALDDWFKDPEGTFQSVFDLDDPNSPLSVFLATEKSERTAHEGAMIALVEQIKDLVSKGKGKKQAKEMGDDFEDDIEWFLTDVKVAEDEVKRTGEQAVKGSGGDKKGDVLVEVGHPSTDDLRITIEAKAGKSAGAYTLEGTKSLWNQMSKSMVLRGAQASIGVVNINNVKKHKPWIDQGRYKILVAVDLENPSGGGLTLLEIAYNVLRYRLIEDLSTKDSSAAEPKLDLARFKELINEISGNTDILNTMRTNLTKMGGIIDNQDSQVTKIERAINSQVGQLKMLLKSTQTGEE